jgi:hypothetical protein
MMIAYGYSNGDKMIDPLSIWNSLRHNFYRRFLSPLHHGVDGAKRC